MSRKFSIISAGPGHPGLLTGRARQAIVQAGEVYAAGRTAGALASLRPDWKLCPPEETARLAAESPCEEVAVLAAGDAGFFGQVETMRRILEPHGQVTVYPGISSMQYLCGKLGESYEDMYWLPDTAGDLLAAVAYHGKVCVLADETRTPAQLCSQLWAAGLGRLRVVVGTRLGTGREHIVDQTAQLLRNKKFASPALMLLFQPSPADASRPVFDSDLAGMDGMLRQEVRWNAVNLLHVQPDETVCELAAGNGAVALELARRANRGAVFALEENSDRMALLARNREALGGWNVRPVPGKTADALAALPPCDAAFLGPRTAGLRDALAVLRDKNRKVRVVVAADSLEGLAETQQALGALRYKNIAVSQLLLSRSRTLGSHTMMLAGETVFLISAGKE